MDAASSSNEKSEGLERPPPIPRELAWIQKGEPVLVSCGIGAPYNALTMGNPDFSVETDSWTVPVKWESWNFVESVDCSRCIQVVELEGEGRMQRRLRSRHQGSSHKDLLPSAKRTRLDDLPATVSSTDSDYSLASPEKKQPAPSRRAKQFDRARKSLCGMPGVSPEEAEEALWAVGPPFGLQEAMKKLRQLRAEKMGANKPGPFEPKLGTKIRKMFKGVAHFGEVIECIKEPVWNKTKLKYVKVWNVLYEDGDSEEMEWAELLRYRNDRPTLPAPCRGRQLQCLELFCGKGIVSQEFCERRWQVMSIDNSKDSNATMKKNILDVKPEELEFVPDFIWASPPCHTYSRLAGVVHRDVAAGKLDKTREAREHNYLFQKMAELMRWAKAKHPHVIIAIENPVGKLQNMPLMAEFTETFNLHSVTVDYCAFGRDEKKPTMIWTNDWGLCTTLAEFKCKEKCPVGLSQGTHAVNVRDASHLFDFSVIPQALAEEVAEYVHSKFVLDRIRKKKAASPRD